MTTHLRIRLLRIVRDTDQAVNLAEWWNANRLDADPMDCELERTLNRHARACLKALEANNMDACEQQTSELAAYGRKLLVSEQAEDAAPGSTAAAPIGPAIAAGESSSERMRLTRRGPDRPGAGAEAVWRRSHE